MPSPKTGILSKLLGYTLLIINILAAIWLWFCYKASVTNPSTIKYIALFTLTTAPAIIVNFLFVFVWLLSKRKWRAFFPVVTLLIFHTMVFEVFAFNYFGNNDLSQGTNKLKVMSWNVHGLGIYDEPHNNHAKGIIETIKEQDPDVLCMPEFCELNYDSMKPYTRAVLNAGDFKYFRFNLDNGLGKWYNLGNTIFSKYPIVNYKPRKIDQYIYLLQADIILPQNKLISIYYLHLCSYDLSDGDRADLSEMKRKEIPDKADIQRSRSYLYRFNVNYIRRANEADSIASILKHSIHPSVVCGDFNDLPASYTYNTIRNKLNDAFVDKGHGIGRTYNQIFPTLRIDHIFYDPSALNIIGYRSPALPYSDHNPVIANFEVK